MLFHFPTTQLTEMQLDFVSGALTVLYYKSIITGNVLLTMLSMFYFAADRYLINLPDTGQKGVNMFLPRLAFSWAVAMVVVYISSKLVMWALYPDTFLFEYMADFGPYPGG